ncbi:prolyl oligopeptidase family serine peptidase [Prosthecobacter sp.]|uniref:alpha/beta hydrolase family protein n=1 Tax=Prosthecobacter sp. TaxID=1965333 RepID=UPI0024884ACC|nr:prolyl oligopeptidase family serine peptidase [Prosthecobacter sp.]MDI1311168.1 prolyl oligopeptidase family serine peptidase [Prosthecobacter sp.]
MLKHLRLLALASALLTATSCSHSARVSGIHESKTSYLSGGKKIVVEKFVLADTKQHPAVIVLYGSGGLLNGKGDMDAFARQLAQRGMAAYMIHYFDRTGTLLAGDKSIAANSEVWQATVKDGIDFISQQPQVRPGPIGMFGYSLGAFLTVGAATTDSRIGVAAELSGGIFDRLKGHTKRYPPLLILHGRNDERVPIHYEQALLKDAQRFHAQPLVHIYPDEGHALSPAAAADAASRALTFLQQHLKP